MKTDQSTFHVFIATLFVIALAVPMIVGFVQTDQQTSEQEKRSLAQWPNWGEQKNLKEFFSSVSDYTADQFGLRETLITANSKIKWSMGYSPSEGVIRGRDNWLFLNIIDPLLSQHQYGRPAVEDGLRKRADHVRFMESELAKRGVVYQHIIASNKMTVYKEYLPAKYSLTDSSASYHFYLDQFTDSELSKQVFAERTLASKKLEYQHAFYFKNDTHWNHLGAYLVFSESIEKLRKTSPELEFDLSKKEFTLDKTPPKDLASLVGLGKELVSEEPRTKFRACARRNKITSSRPGVNQSVCNRNNTVVLMIGDSFMKYLMPFYSESVGHMYMVTQDISRKNLLSIIDELQPDLVIEELVERHLPGQVPE